MSKRITVVLGDDLSHLEGTTQFGKAILVAYPEHSLSPRMQAKKADEIIQLSKEVSYVLLTHSEIILLQLCLRGLQTLLGKVDEGFEITSSEVQILWYNHENETLEDVPVNEEMEFIDPPKYVDGQFRVDYDITVEMSFLRCELAMLKAEEGEEDEEAD